MSCMLHAQICERVCAVHDDPLKVETCKHQPHCLTVCVGINTDSCVFAMTWNECLCTTAPFPRLQPRFLERGRLPDSRGAPTDGTTCARSNYTLPQLPHLLKGHGQPNLGWDGSMPRGLLTGAHGGCCAMVAYSHQNASIPRGSCDAFHR